jgi:hypothetical protein
MRRPLTVNAPLTALRQSAGTGQAGTPMTVTGNGTSSLMQGRGVSIFCLQVSSGGGAAERGAAGGRRPPVAGSAWVYAGSLRHA